MQPHLLLCISLLSHFCAAQMHDPSPCQQSFKYVLEGNDYFGVITLDGLESGRAVIKVAFSQRDTLTANNYGRITPHLNGDLQLIQSPVSFLVHFPNPRKPPKLTELSVNGKVICSGPEYPPPSSWFELIYSVNTYNPNTIWNPTYEPISRPAPVQSLAPRPQPSTTTPPPLPPPPTPTPTAAPPRKTSTFHLQESVTLPPPPPPTPTYIPYSTAAPTRKTSTFPIYESVTIPPAIYSNIFLAEHLQQNASLLNTQNIGQNIGHKIDQINQHTTQKPRINVTCGIEGTVVRPFLHGGSELIRGQFPWLTAVYRKDSVQSLTYICGGTLISARSVVSAAHCFQNLAASQVAVFLGRINLESYSEDGFVTRDVERLIKHPEYNNLPDADIAVLRMAAISSFTDFIRPICLWSETTVLSEVVGLSGTVAGWGSNENGQLVSPIAKKTKIKIVSEVDCLRSSAVFTKLVTNRTFCGGNRDGIGPCLGDSGSGLVLERNNRWMLRGVVSFGQTKRGQCNLYEYVVYVDVAQHLSWLMENLK